MKHLLILVMGFLFAHALFAQNSASDTLVIYGKVVDVNEKSPITSVHVKAVDLNDPTHGVEPIMRDSGRYELNITEERNYLITYSAPEYISKSVQVEVAGPTTEQWKGGYGMNVDITLVPKSSGHDPALYAEPFGISRFNTDSARYDWDLEHTKARLEQIKKATVRK